MGGQVPQHAPNPKDIFAPDLGSGSNDTASPGSHRHPKPHLVPDGDHPADGSFCCIACVQRHMTDRVGAGHCHKRFYFLFSLRVH